MRPKPQNYTDVVHFEGTYAELGNVHQVKTEFKNEKRKKQSVYVSIHLRNRLRKGGNEAMELVLILKSITMRYLCKIVLSGMEFISILGIL